MRKTADSGAWHRKKTAIGSPLGKEPLDARCALGRLLGPCLCPLRCHLLLELNATMAIRGQTPLKPHKIV